MISIDTNVLLYSLNRDCAEHAEARRFVEGCAKRPDVAVAELVLVELYVLLRNPAVVQKPLDAPRAAAVCETFRSNPRWALIDGAPVMDQVWEAAARRGVARRHVFDSRLAFTLLHNGVTEFATRNAKDFADFPFDRVFDPLSEAS